MTRQASVSCGVFPTRDASFAKLSSASGGDVSAMGNCRSFHVSLRVFKLAHDLSSEHALDFGNATADGSNALDARERFEEL